MARIPDDVRAAVAEAGRAERTSRDIAREFGISIASVSNICRTAGVSRDRSATQKATRSRTEDMAARRSALAADLLTSTQRALARLTEATRYREKYTDAYEGGGSTTRYEWLDVDEPYPADVQRLAISAGVLLDKHLKLIDRDAAPELVAARSLLETAGQALVSAFGDGADQVTDD